MRRQLRYGRDRRTRAEWVGPMHGPDEGVSEALLFKALKIYILAIARLMQLEF